MVLVPNRIAESKRQSGNCPLPGTLRTQAEADFRKLESEFNKAKGGDNSRETFLKLAERFRAHTIEDDFMDFNYGIMLVTNSIKKRYTVSIFGHGPNDYRCSSIIQCECSSAEEANLLAQSRAREMQERHPNLTNVEYQVQEVEG